SPPNSSHPVAARAGPGSAADAGADAGTDADSEADADAAADVAAGASAPEDDARSPGDGSRPANAPIPAAPLRTADCVRAGVAALRRAGRCLRIVPATPTRQPATAFPAPSGPRYTRQAQSRDVALGFGTPRPAGPP